MSITKALGEFHADFKGIKKTGVNPHFGSQHFELDEIVRATTPILLKHGLVVTHRVAANECVTTIHYIEDGSTIDSVFPVNTQAQPQQVGSALTYAKRYNLCALLNISEPDDDGNAAQAAQAPSKPLATTEQRSAIQEHKNAGTLDSATVSWLEQNGDRMTQEQADRLLKKVAS